MTHENNKKCFIQALQEASIEVTDIQMMKLEQYVSLLLKWNKKLNLIAPNTENVIWTRHILDALQLTQHIGGGQGVLDVGSGAGLPAVPLAIVSSNRVTACESITKKANFIKEVRRKLDLKDSLSVAGCMVQDLASAQKKYDVVTSRAWAKIDEILELCTPLLKKEGQFLLLKGVTSEQEVEAAKKIFCMTAHTKSSITNSTGRIVILQRVSREA